MSTYTCEHVEKGEPLIITGQSANSTVNMQLCMEAPQKYEN